LKLLCIFVFPFLNWHSWQRCFELFSAGYLFRKKENSFSICATTFLCLRYFH
jgi:hypothetical protein